LDSSPASTPDYIDIDDAIDDNDVTTEVVVYRRAQQRIAALEKVDAKQASKIAEQAAENAALTTENLALTSEVAALTTEVMALKIANNAPAHTSDFISTIDFKRHFAEFVHIEMLLVSREVCKEWNDVVVEHVDRSVESGAMVIHGGKDVNYAVAGARDERQGLMTQVIFLRNIVQIGENAYNSAVNLVVVDIPEGVERIGARAFHYRESLTAISFPRTLT